VTRNVIELLTFLLEYLKVLVWPIVFLVALIWFPRTIRSVLPYVTKVKLNLFGVEIETTIANLERVLTAGVGARLTERQWDLLEEIFRKGRLSVAEKNYVMTLQKDLAWIRPIRNAGLVSTLPEGKIIEEAEQLDLTPLAR
jgi:hypothetical protein